jgi:hypothetical protein
MTPPDVDLSMETRASQHRASACVDRHELDAHSDRAVGEIIELDTLDGEAVGRGHADRSTGEQHLRVVNGHGAGLLVWSGRRATDGRLLAWCRRPASSTEMFAEAELAALVGHRFPGGRYRVEHWENWLVSFGRPVLDGDHVVSGGAVREVIDSVVHCDVWLRRDDERVVTGTAEVALQHA